MSAECERIDGFGRLEDVLLQASAWYLWGPYVSERQWGTVREDYSADGAAWDYLPHDHARSRGQPRSAGNQVCLLVSADPPAWRQRRATAAPAPERERAHRGRRARHELRPGHHRSARRSRRVLRRADPARRERRAGNGHAPGLCRDAVGQAALQLRRDPLAGRRPDPAPPPGQPP